MQPLKYYPQPERPSDPTPLEMAIYNYELKAKAFYDKKAQLGDAKESDITERLNQDYKHLEQERNRLESIVKAQMSLAAYRAKNLQEGTETLQNEAHHNPENKLAKFLAAAGEIKPTNGHEAHHIIPGKGRYDQPAIALARLRLHAHGIGINDPMNGVWLFGKVKGKEFDWATSDAVPHRRIHRHNYEVWIGRSFVPKRSKVDFVNLLRIVKLKIKTGTMPEFVMMPKGTEWDGVS